MSICLLFIRDGRDDVHERSWASAQEHLPLYDVISEGVVVDDRDHQLGFAGAVRLGWDKALETGADHVFHLEADFTFNEPAPVVHMLELLERHPEIAQVSLKRQAWSPDERDAGGIVERHPDDFDERTDGELVWTGHRRYWTTTPSLYSTRFCRIGWPQEPHSEGFFTHTLLADPMLRFAIWGRKFDPPRVEHIGIERAGHSY